MITAPYSHYLPFLASEGSLLLLSDFIPEDIGFIQESFNDFIQYGLTEESIDMTNNILMQHKINIVIIHAVKSPELARKVFDLIRKYDPRIIIIIITSINASPEELALIRDANASLFEPYTTQQFNSKLFTTLGIFYVIKSIGRREIKLKSKGSNTAQELYLDTYQGTTLFIVDDLAALNSNLANGELSEELLRNIADKLVQISEVFAQNSALSDVAPIIKDLSTLLCTLDLSSIDPEKLKAFDYLSYIIEDINQYLLDLFVDRIVSDIEVFIHSLSSNIDYLRNFLVDKKENSSDLEFFND